MYYNIIVLAICLLSTEANVAKRGRRQTNPEDCYGTECEYVIDFPTEPFDINIPINISEIIENNVPRITKYMSELARECLPSQTKIMADQMNVQSTILEMLSNATLDEVVNSISIFQNSTEKKYTRIIDIFEGVSSALPVIANILQHQQQTQKEVTDVLVNHERQLDRQQNISQEQVTENHDMKITLDKLTTLIEQQGNTQRQIGLILSRQQDQLDHQQIILANITATIENTLPAFVEDVAKQKTAIASIMEGHMRSLRTACGQDDDQVANIVETLSSIDEKVDSIQIHQLQTTELSIALQAHDEKLSVAVRILNEGVKDKIRLVNGASCGRGRVEAFYNGEWGTVCDDDWDNNDAKVVCRQLGFPYANAVAKIQAFFGQGTGQIWLDNVGCTGSETSFTACSHRGWGEENCSHYEDAGVICQ